MLIGELAQRTGASPRALRYYEGQGLLEAERMGNGYRSYPAGAELRVRQIRGLLAAGFSTQTLVAILPCARGEGPEIELCPSVVAAMRATLDRIDTQLQGLSGQYYAVSALLDGTTGQPDRQSLGLSDFRGDGQVGTRERARPRLAATARGPASATARKPAAS